MPVGELMPCPGLHWVVSPTLGWDRPKGAYAWTAFRPAGGHAVDMVRRFTGWSASLSAAVYAARHTAHV